MTRIAILIASAALTAILLLAALATVARAQGRTYYDHTGKAIIRETTDSQGTTTSYGADGRAMTRESRTRQGSTLYDARTGKPIAKSRY
jgi:hypothetical protein